MFLPGHFLFEPSQRIHFIGIGGIGMSGIAEILLTMGYAVSGSDLRRSAITDRLAGMGAVIYEGHAAANTAASDVVVTSSAVPATNPEVMEARARKIPVIQRAEMLAELMRLKYGIAVAGMHGKTTTTSMIAAVLGAGGGEGNLDPTVVVGGRVGALGSNARLGTSQYLVDCYRDMADVEGAFVEFMDRVPFYGATTACIDNALLRGILERVHRRVYTYGEAADADFRLQLMERQRGPHISESRCGAPNPVEPWRFEVDYRGLVLGPFTLHVPGRHNVLNATAAIAIGVQLGIAPDGIARGLESFRGVDRRFQVRGTVRGITVVDDYGHHPTEIMATLRAAREAGYRRVHVLFQPHRYTRTRDLLPEFARAFADADTLQVLDIYAASEEPIAGVDARGLVEAIRGAGAGTATVSGGVEYAESMAAGVAALVSEAREGDVILTLGAGSVSQASGMLLEALAS